MKSKAPCLGERGRLSPPPGGPSFHPFSAGVGRPGAEQLQLRGGLRVELARLPRFTGSVEFDCVVKVSPFPSTAADGSVVLEAILLSGLKLR